MKASGLNNSVDLGVQAIRELDDMVSQCMEDVADEDCSDTEDPELMVIVLS